MPDRHSIPENDVEAFYYTTEHDVLPVQMGCCSRCNEKLRKVKENRRVSDVSDMTYKETECP